MIKTVILYVHEVKFITKCYVAHLQVLISNRRAQGIEFIHRGISFSVQTDREVILTAGTYGSPAILIRSGIGPAEQLQRLQVCSSILLVEWLVSSWFIAWLVGRLVAMRFLVNSSVGWLVGWLVGLKTFCNTVGFSVSRLVDRLVHCLLHG